MIGAYARLILRPGLVLWALWMLGVLGGLWKSDYGRQVVLGLAPLLMGLILGQPVRDAQSRTFSWTIPHLRARLMLPLFAVLVLGALVTSLIIETDVAPLPEFAIAGFFCFLGALLKIDCYSFIPIKKRSNTLVWLGAILLLVRFDLILSAAQSSPLASGLVGILGAALLAGSFARKETHRRLFGASYFSLINALNPSAFKARAGQRKTGTKTAKQLSLDWLDSKAPDRRLLRMSFIESYGPIGLTGFMARVILGVFIILALLGSGFEKALWVVLIPLMLYAFAYQHPLHLREGLPRPLARDAYLRNCYWGSLCEACIFVGAAGLGVFVLDLVSPPSLSLSDHLIIGYATPDNVALWLLLTLVYFPVIQFGRRYRGFALPSYIAHLSLALGLTAATAYLTLHWALPKLGTAAVVAALFLCYLLVQMIYFGLLRRAIQFRDMPNPT